MLPFLAKTWFLWWMVAIVLGLRWFHVMSSRSKALDANAVAMVEGDGDERDSVASRILQKAQTIYLPELLRAA